MKAGANCSRIALLPKHITNWGQSSKIDQIRNTSAGSGDSFRLSTGVFLSMVSYPGTANILLYMDDYTFQPRGEEGWKKMS